VFDVEFDVVNGAIPVILIVEPDVETNVELCNCKVPVVVVLTKIFPVPKFFICVFKI
jgi:hypothetical protein